MAFSIKLTERRPDEAQATVVKFAGTLDTAAAMDAEKTIAPLLAKPPKAVVMDLSGLKMITSAGISVLLQARKTLEAQGVSLAAVGIPAHIQKAFDIMRTLPAAQVFKDTKELDEYLSAVQRRIVEGE
jgi:anti-anti-sigma factor